MQVFGTVGVFWSITLTTIFEFGTEREIEIGV